METTQVEQREVKVNGKVQVSLEDKLASVIEVITKLEEEKALLIEEIRTKMNEQGITNEKTEKGQFLLAWRKTWEYSTDTAMIGERFKEAKKREENNGTAKITNQTEYLRFIPVKGEKTE